MAVPFAVMYPGTVLTDGDALDPTVAHARARAVHDNTWLQTERQTLSSIGLKVERGVEAVRYGVQSHE